MRGDDAQRLQRIEQAVAMLPASACRDEIEQRITELRSVALRNTDDGQVAANRREFLLTRCECLLESGTDGAPHRSTGDIDVTYVVSTAIVARLLKLRGWLLRYPPRLYAVPPLRGVLAQRLAGSRLFLAVKQVYQAWRHRGCG